MKFLFFIFYKKKNENKLKKNHKKISYSNQKRKTTRTILDVIKYIKENREFLIDIINDQDIIAFRTFDGCTPKEILNRLTKRVNDLCKQMVKDELEYFEEEYRKELKEEQEAQYELYEVMNYYEINNLDEYYESYE